MSSTKTISDVACTICGCVCDDLRVTVVDGQVRAAEGACELAEPWYLAQSEAVETDVARIDDQSVAFDTAINRAAEILRDSKAPLVYGLSRSSTPGQRAAVRLADRLGAVIDTTASTCHAPSIMAFQVVGESTSSLGEAKNRADVVVYWGSDPVSSHPRHLERFVDSAGMFVPRGRADRHVIVIDTNLTETAKQADTFIQVEPRGDFELLWTLRSFLAWPHARK